MSDEDNEFFILVLGVLAAIIMVISWWYTSGGTATDGVVVANADRTAQAAESSSADDAAADDGGTEGESDDGGDRTFDSADSDSDGESTGSDTDPTVDAGDDQDDAEGSDTEAELATGTLIDAMLDDPELSVITGLLREEGLDQVLSDPDGDPLTVFAPSNDAISTAAGSDTTVAVLEGNRTGVLTYHVVPGAYTIGDLKELARGSRAAQLATVQGEPLSVVLEGESIVINGNTVITGDATELASGIVHTVDNVLVPPIAALNTIVGAEPILFASGSAEIESESFDTLDQFIEVLAGNSVSVSIEGHTDSSGDPILNQDLSEGRARSVRNYLVANGIEESRLSATGFGASKPVADNDSEEGRALNRRIEFTLDS